MNAITTIVGSTNLATVNALASVVLTDPVKFDQFYDGIAAEVRAHVADTTTKNGRDAIAAIAYKVARTKTAIDEAGKKLNEAARVQINAVDAARRSIRDKLDALRDEARKPLDEWDAADASRVADCRQVINDIKAATIVNPHDTSDTVAARLADVLAFTISEERFAELAPEATGLLDTARASLQAVHGRLLQQEADARELAKLRADAAERAERNHLAKIEIDRVEAERLAAERAKAKRVADAAAEAERIAKAEQAAAQRERNRLEEEEAAKEAGRLAAAREAERSAAEAIAARDREHAETLARVEREKAAENARIKQEADEAEAARQVEIARRQKADADRLAAEQRRREEDEKRAANARHRSHVKGKAKDAFIEHASLTEYQARAVVNAIVAGFVPAVAIQF